MDVALDSVSSVTKLALSVDHCGCWRLLLAPVVVPVVGSES